jgi:stringent starvation protein B
MLRALWEWCMDAGLTPQILVNAGAAGVDVPKQFVKDGTIVLNIHDRAVRDLKMSNDAVTFSARFSGQPRNLFVPVDAVVAIYARENGQGLFFEIPDAEAQPDESVVQPVDGASDAPRQSDDVAPRRGKPNLTIV